MIAAAPSLIPEEFAAVTIPSFLNAGRNLEILSAVVPGRGPSSVSTITVFFFSLTSTGTISSLNLPASIAAVAFCCELAANSSNSSLVSPHCSATFSAVIPIWYWLKASVSASLTIQSFNTPLFILYPKRALSRQNGARDMFSIPPATTISASPAIIFVAARFTQFRPEPQTTLIVVAGTSIGKPALREA